MGFWQTIKSNQWMRRAFSDETVLKPLIKVMFDNKVFDTKNVSKTQILWTDDYKKNIHMEGISNDHALKKARFLMFIIFIIVLGLSYYFLGLVPFIINIIIFAFMDIFPVSQEAKKGATNNIYAIGWNVYWFDEKDSKGCKEYIEQGNALRPLHKVIKELKA
jgi:hypothetical protein